MIEIKSVQTSAKFSHQIEIIVKEKCLTYMDAILYYAENNEIELESVARLVKINSTIKEKLLVEAEDLNFMKEKSARLPI